MLGKHQEGVSSVVVGMGQTSFRFMLIYEGEEIRMTLRRSSLCKETDIEVHRTAEIQDTKTQRRQMDSR
jgi:hypothetical protein